MLVTKDENFQRLSVLPGPPPKVICIRLGNCATADVARLLRFRAKEVHAFVENSGLPSSRSAEKGSSGHAVTSVALQPAECHAR